jgi:hypothetical protein
MISGITAEYRTEPALTGVLMTAGPVSVKKRDFSCQESKIVLSRNKTWRIRLTKAVNPAFSRQ